MSEIWRKVAKFIGLDKYRYESVEIEPHVIDAICQFAKDAHPREFIMFLEGTVKNNTLTIEALNYQEYFASEDSAMPYIRLPMTTNIFGTVHSHPGPSNRPSDADLHVFSKHGTFHLIIKHPYRPADIQAYDARGRKTSFFQKK